MEILKVEESDLCPYFDWLIGSKAEEFVSGGHTHIQCEDDDSIIECEYLGPNHDGGAMVLLGESVMPDIED